MKGADGCEWGVGVACGGVWWSGVITPEAGYTGPLNVSRVRFPDGTPLWRRRAQARMPPEDPEYLMAMCRAQALEAQKDPGRSLFLLCLYSFSFSAMFLSHLIHAHTRTHTYTTIHTYIPDCPRVALAVMIRWVNQYLSFVYFSSVNNMTSKQILNRVFCFHSLYTYIFT